MTKKPVYKFNQQPKISIQRLAEFMTASKIKERSILRDCKYQKIGQISQHSNARRIISRYFMEDKDVDWLNEKADEIKNIHTSSEYLKKKNRNDNYFIKSFATNLAGYRVKKVKFFKGTPLKIMINGVILTMKADLIVTRLVEDKNYEKIGALIFHHNRSVKSDDLANSIYNIEAALMFNILEQLNTNTGYVADKKLCLVIDALRGNVIHAPNNSKTIYNQIKSACLSIVGIWGTLAPPKDFN